MRRILAEAAAQYDVCPSDYLEGVIPALHETMHNAPVVARQRDDDESSHPARRTASGRPRDYYLDRIAALLWILGERAAQPVQTNLTEPATPRPSPHDDGV